MGCAASLAQVGRVEDPPRITHNNTSPTPPANAVKSTPATLPNYYKSESLNL